VPPGETLIVPAPAGRTEVDRVLGTCGSKGLVNSRSWQAVNTNTKKIKTLKLDLEVKIELNFGIWVNLFIKASIYVNTII
jgi:hypothetical protein